MVCECGYADECDGDTAVFHPLQEGGMCSVRPCQKPMNPVESGEQEKEWVLYECI